MNGPVPVGSLLGMRYATVLLLPLLLALVGATPNVSDVNAPAKPANSADLRTRVQQLEERVAELESTVARLEAALSKGVAPEVATLPAVDRAAIAKGLKEGHYVVGMTVAQVKKVMGNDPYEQSVDHRLVNGRSRDILTIKDAYGETLNFDENGILVHFGR